MDTRTAPRSSKRCSPRFLPSRALPQALVADRPAMASRGRLLNLWRHSAAVAAAALLTACAGLGGPAITSGDSIDSVRQRLGAPSAEHPLPDGGQRLEYSGGAYGTTTLMVDADPQGRVLRAENVRDEAHFNRVKAGITQAQLLQELGAPSRIWGVRYRNQTVWSYRFETPFCQIFHVGLSPQGMVEDTSYGPDPICEDREHFGLWRRH